MFRFLGNASSATGGFTPGNESVSSPGLRSQVLMNHLDGKTHGDSGFYMLLILFILSKLISPQGSKSESSSAGTPPVCRSGC